MRLDKQVLANEVVVAPDNEKPIHLLHGSGLHHINVRAFDLDETISFYEQAFGFRLLFRWDGVDGMRGQQVFFRNPLQGAQLDIGDGQILELIPAPKKAVRPSELASSFNHIGLRVSNLDETYARALANGAKPYPIRDGAGGVWDGPATIKLKASPPFQRSFVVRAAHVMGPNGEVIELFES
ncbi:Catechol 2,3-dioxygenase [Bosea sp. CRIB-10]|uniref:VOC family protein n=1 Tax=Bosea sp. CRIB-10 TaxID=378404 RepID=UPI0008E481DC|nr:VOC family protein [Bosea sp. CRIB-10]SFD51753.1 Catechol 2,3-dioxygenase [Bosea sp. CRIB-10]